MTAEFRIIDIGEALTVGLVEMDPTGEPASIELEGIFDSFQLSDLREKIDAVVICLDKPVLSLRNVV